MRYRLSNIGLLPAEVIEKRAHHNPYIGEIDHYPDILLHSPDKEAFSNFWMEKGLNQTKVHVEAGCGSGLYLLQLSERYPDDFFIGFEVRYKRLVLAARKLKTLKRSNVLLLRENAEFISDYFQKKSIDTFHVNFPDPWAKSKQRKHRLLKKEYLKLISSLLKLGGSIHFKTDHLEYFHSVHKIIKDLPNFKISEFTTDLAKDPLSENNIETEFERLFKSKGNPPIGYMKINYAV